MNLSRGLNRFTRVEPLSDLTPALPGTLHSWHVFLLHVFK